MLRSSIKAATKATPHKTIFTNSPSKKNDHSKLKYSPTKVKTPNTLKKIDPASPEVTGVNPIAPRSKESKTQRSQMPNEKSVKFQKSKIDLNGEERESEA
jgi:hypothetical protein